MAVEQPESAVKGYEQGFNLLFVLLNLQKKNPCTDDVPKLDRTIPERYPKCSPERPRWARGRSCSVPVLFLGPEARKPPTEDSKQSKHL